MKGRVGLCLQHVSTSLSKHGDPMFPHFCPVDQNLACVRTRGQWAAKTKTRPLHQPTQPQYANCWDLLTRQRHHKGHRPQRPTECSDLTKPAKERTGGCPGPVRKQQPDGMLDRGYKYSEGCPQEIISAHLHQPRANPHQPSTNPTRTPKRGKKTPHRPLIQPAIRPWTQQPPQPFFSPSLWYFFQLRPPPEPPPFGVTVHT